MELEVVAVVAIEHMLVGRDTVLWAWRGVEYSYGEEVGGVGYTGVRQAQ